MATKKANNKYAPSQAFLDSCRKVGNTIGTATGKAELVVAKTTVAVAMGTKVVAQGLIAGHKASR